MAARTLYDKIWEAHTVTDAGDGSALIYIDRHLVHEVTSPQAFDGLRLNKRLPWRLSANLAVPDHNVPTQNRRLGIKDEMFEKRDIHIHVPDGATPKDGPSAGAAMTTAFVSALTGIPVKAGVAMTGEITLRGEVTAIGGLKEKLLAAHRGGITTVLIPEENVKDLQDIPANARDHLEIIPVRWIDQVLKIALESEPQPLPDDEVPAKPATEAVATPAVAATSGPDALPH